MRFVAILVVFLGLCGWTLAHWPQAATMVAQPEFTWRRTAAGWERVDRWPNQAVESKRLNPLLVGSLQLGVSLVALMAGADAERHRHARAIQEAVGQSPGQSADMHVGINTT